jgi:hypothetical protein
MAAQQSPAEFAREIFEYDVEILDHLIFRARDHIEDDSLDIGALIIAESFLDQPQALHYDSERLVMDLWKLDENKKTALELLKGEE